jgi:hypothetical protein
VFAYDINEQDHTQPKSMHQLNNIKLTLIHNTTKVQLIACTSSGRMPLMLLANDPNTALMQISCNTL